MSRSCGDYAPHNVMGVVLPVVLAILLATIGLHDFFGYIELSVRQRTYDKIYFPREVKWRVSIIIWNSIRVITCISPRRY